MKRSKKSRCLKVPSSLFRLPPNTSAPLKRYRCTFNNTRRDIILRKLSICASFFALPVFTSIVQNVNLIPFRFVVYRIWGRKCELWRNTFGGGNQFLSAFHPFASTRFWGDSRARVKNYFTWVGTKKLFVIWMFRPRCCAALSKLSSEAFRICTGRKMIDSWHVKQIKIFSYRVVGEIYDSWELMA